MSIVEMKVPSPGESISEVEIAEWLVSDGDYVEKDQAIAEVDSDKASLELPAEASGTITLKAEEGDTVEVGQVVALIDTSAEAPDDKGGKEEKKEKSDSDKEKDEESKKEKSEKKEKEDSDKDKEEKDKKYGEKDSEKKDKDEEFEKLGPKDKKTHASGIPSPAASKLMKEKDISSDQVDGSGKGGRITKQDVEKAIAAGFDKDAVSGWGGTRDKSSEKMSMLRRKVAERLVAVKNETAMLTTFNEVDMKPIMDLRNKYKKAFSEHHEVNLGFMSFFTKACTEALNMFPAVNAQIEGKEMILHDYADIAIAVSSPKGLMVPVIRNAEQMSLAEIESEVKRLAVKARDGKITPDEMSGGTFTITNGGVFGSMLSTPIINPPQSAILGMHNIVERPVVIDGKVEIRPIMYVALSYDHRIIDGKESVSFLVKVKEMLENPERMIFGGKDPYEVLLGL